MRLTYQPAARFSMSEQTGAQPSAPVTVAIATLNRPEALALCLDTLLAGEVLPAEIIVVDQSRDDRTRLVVEQRQSCSVKLVYHHHDGVGLGIAQNIAIAQASNVIVAVTDDDCAPAPDWIAKIGQAFAPPNQIDALTGRVLPLGPDQPGLYPVSLRLSTTRAEFTGLAMPWNVGSGNNFVVKREWLRWIGGNDVRLGPGSAGKGGVDMDLFYRLLLAGARIRYEPELIVYHARTSKASRLSRRIPYGYGMGACIGLWLRQSDYNAFRVLCHWLVMRARRLGLRMWRREWLLAYEEMLVLAGTVGGFIHGLRVPGAPIREKKTP